MRSLVRLSVCPALLLATIGVLPAGAQLPTIADKTRGMERQEGLFPLHLEQATGKVWMEIPALDTEFLYVTSLPQGLGSNDIGLDRGQLGGEHLVRFVRYGPRVLLVESNTRFRAETDNPDERRAVEEAFARSTLWGFTVAAATGDRILVDATDFALRDVHNVTGTLQRTRQGTYRLDASRSVVYPPRTKAFPRNTEIEVLLTFTGDNAGRWVRDIAPSPEALTVHERHSFIALPEPGYEPLPNDPRAGFFGVSWADYAVPIREPVVRRFASRHRLQKRNPEAAVSEPVTPIVYYVDRGAPEPIRSALLDGARWWNQAFEAAGYRNAFRVELMPEGADPMDVRYNVIQWVHRATRGWSYGASISDPRTGEIIKGHVSLGSLRVRQDFLLAEGLLSPYETGDEAPPELEAMALARIRQLSAHEVGHTLGLAHNYIASAQDRASVMDYPHPLATVRADGTIDLSAAYAVGIGEWDKVAITWGYGDPPAAGRADRLEGILADARARGITFLTDQDARPAGSAHPQTHLWDNGRDVVGELARMMEVRRVALQRFGERTIRRGMPLATLEEALVPLYLHHRYQVEAVTKLVGGVTYTYALRGDGQPPLTPVSGAEQRRALDAALRTLRPEALAIPGTILDRLPPRPALYPLHRELFARETGLVFDPLTPAAAATGMVLDFLFHEERAARLVIQAARDPGTLSLGEMLDRTVAVAFDTPAANPWEAEIGRTVQRVVVERLMALAADAGMSQVSGMARLKLVDLRDRMTEEGAARGAAGDMARAHALQLADDISRFLERPWERDRSITPRPAPPGSPIGAGGEVQGVGNRE